MTLIRPLPVTPTALRMIVIMFAAGICTTVTETWDASETMGSSDRKVMLTVGAVLPYSRFHLRSYYKALQFKIADFIKKQYIFPNFVSSVRSELVMMTINPSPNEILHALCDMFLVKNVSVILYLSNNEVYGSNTASSQYLLQLIGYLGIPSICWNADNSGLAQKRSNSIILQLAPSIEHQTEAMLSILKRYNWYRFSIVTSQIAGHNEFIEAVRDSMKYMKAVNRFTLLDTVVVDGDDKTRTKEQLMELVSKDTRIILLYVTQEEAVGILEVATELGLTGKDFVWIVTQSIVGNIDQDNVPTAPSAFPIGMLGVHFDTSTNSLLAQVENALKVFGNGLELFVNDTKNSNISLQPPNLSCYGAADSRWTKGEYLYRFLRNVSFQVGGGTNGANGDPVMEFKSDGSLKYAKLEVVNLDEHLKWQRIGSWTNGGLIIDDIVWPGNSPVPPQGVPDKFHLKAVFLEEPPFVYLDLPDPVTQKCINRGVRCRVAKEADLIGVNHSMAIHNSSMYQCCSGFSVDLMEKYAADLNFTYEMFRVEDGKWGTEVHKVWNGLIATLINKKADLVVTSIKINAERETVVDFTEPFMDTGIAIVVMKRTGIVSPKAFLEPFDTISWLLILLVSIQVAALAIFSFEWCSPSGYDMKIKPPRDHKFSLFRTYWLVWAVLFGAAVNVDCPRGYTARFMSSIWAMFAVVFLAIYTAKLAAFMITREEFYELKGIDDERLLEPFTMTPPLKFGTIPFGNTESVLQKHYLKMYQYMKKHNRSTVAEGMRALKKGELDAFIYDATVLEYLVGQDDGCKLLTVGSWYATTGYGIAFPKNSKHMESFNSLMMTYRENGELERLQRFWLTKGCRSNRDDRLSSKSLSLDQFMSAYILLATGILLAALLLFFEHIYFRYMRKQLAKTDTGGCCALVSLSMGKSLTFRGAVFEAQDAIRQHRKHKCRDPLCDLHLWKVKHQLDLAHLHIHRLEKSLRKHSVDADNFARIEDIALVSEIAHLYQHHDMTRSRISTNEPAGGFIPAKYHGGLFYESVASEVAELETVL